MAKVLRWPAGQRQEKNQSGKKGIRGFLKEILKLQDQGVNNKGISGEWKVARELAASLSDDWIIINDIKIKARQDKTQVDHLVLGPPGIFCLETKNWNTAACNKQGEWFRYHNRLWVPLSSPVEQHLAKVETLTDRFQGLLASVVSVNGIIVFANPGKFDFSQAQLPDNIKVIGLPGLLEYLRRSEAEGTLYSQEQLETLITAIDL